MRTPLRLVVAVAMLVAGSIPAVATMLAPALSLTTVTAESGRIVHATVIDVRSGRDDAGLPATWVTFQVARTLKGARAERVTMKQFGTTEPSVDGTLTRVPDLPRFTAGEELVVFLRPESPRGFTSPVGFEQGVYRVTHAGGRRVARSAGDGATRELEEFIDLVDRLVEKHPSH